MNIDVILNILYFCEIKTVYNISLLNRYFYEICNSNKNYILRNVLKNKKYKNNINFILNKKNFINNFYKVDNGNIYNNIIYSYELEYYDITKFLLSNCKISNYINIYKDTMNDFKIASLVAGKNGNLKVLCEVIRYTFLDKSNLNFDLEELKYLSEFSFPLNLNWKKTLKEELIKLTSKIELYNVDSIGYVISMMTKRWDFLIEDLNGSGKVWEMLYFSCQNLIL